MESNGGVRAGRRASLIVILALLMSILVLNASHVGFVKAAQFGPNVLVDDSPVNTYEPAIAVDGNGKLHAVWQDTRNVDYDIYYSNSIDGGATWSSSIRIDNAFLGQPSYEPSVAVDKSGGLYDGNIYVVLRDARNSDSDIFVTVSTDGGTTWSADVRIDNAPAAVSSARPSIVVDDGGLVYAVWDDPRSGSNQIYISRSDDGGSTWNPDVQVSASIADNSRPSIATYGPGIIYTAWHEYDGSSFSIICARSIDSGSTWFSVQVATGTSYRGNVDIAVDSNGKIYLAWIDEVAMGNTPIFFSSSSTQGLSWTPKTRVDDSTVAISTLLPRIEVNPLGILVVWEDNRNGDWDIFYTDSVDGGNTWGDGLMNNNDIRVNDNPIGDNTVQSQPNIAVSNWGIYVVWSDRRTVTSTHIYFASYVISFLWITEFRDSPEGNELIEIFNYGGLDLNLAGYYLSPDGGATQWFLSPLGMISPGEYRSIGDTSGDLIIPLLDLNDESGIISLYNSTSDLIYSVRYGQSGTAPDPLSGESTARYWDSTIYLENWTREPTPTFGAQNDVPPINTVPEVVLNEVMFYPDAASYGFVELMYIGNISLDISNYKIVCDTEYTIPATTVLDAIDSYFMLFYADDTGFFGQMTSAGDNVYLYDDTGELLDMVGWNSVHIQNRTVSRVPNGNGTYQGYNDVTSEAAGWIFDQAASISLVLIAPDQLKWGETGVVITYNLTVKNKQTVADTIDITNVSTPNGWLVEVFDEFGLTKISDVALGPYGSPIDSINVMVKATIPSIPPIGDIEYSTIIATSSNNSLYSDSATLETRVYPYLEVSKTADPTTIYLKGTGPPYNEETTVTLGITGRGAPFRVYAPQDVVFMIDSSGSMGNNDPTNERLTAAKGYVDKLSGDDRGAVVDFDDNGWLVPFGWPIGDHLSTNYVAIKANIDTINSAGGTDIHDAILVANNEFLGDGMNLGYGDLSHVWVEILLTDGESNYNDHTLADIINEANRAATNGIIIYTIALNTTGSADWQLLRQIAAIAGGLFYEAPDPSYLQEIYDDIAARVSTIAGRDINPTDVSPMIRDVLPSYIDYVPGTFIDPSTNLTKDPDFISLDGNTLEWNITKIYLGETWSVSFNVTSTQLGFVPVNVFTDSRVEYTNHADDLISILFPEVWINVIAPVQPPDLIPGNVPMPFGIKVNATQLVDAIGSPPMSENLTVGVSTIHLISTNVTNIGNGSTGSSFDVTFYNCTDTGVPIDPSFFSTTLGPLGAGTSSPTVAKNWLAPSIPWTDYYLCIKVDSNDDVNETDETNNIYVIHFYTTTGYPDLIPTNIEINSVPYSFPVNVTVGQRVQIKSQVENIGTVSNTGNFYYAISEEPSPTPFFNVSVGVMPPSGLSLVYIANWTAPLIPGSYNITFFADSDGSIAESDELNNIITIEFRVFALPEPPDPIVGVDGDDIVLEWSAVPEASSYKVYGGESPEEIDFAATISGIIVGTAWEHTDGNRNHKEYYYIIRSVDIRGWEGPSSDIIGKYTKAFPRGYSTFSLPLEPFETNRISWYTTDMPLSDADTIYRYDYSYQRWIGHPKLLPEGVDDFDLVMGEGYMIFAKEPFNYAFTGRPGTTIRYASGMSQDPRIGTEGAFRASLSLEKVSNGIKLSWSTPQDVDLGTLFQPYETAASYNIYRARDRDGFKFANPYASTTDTSYIDENADGNEYYYMVVPVNAFGREGSSTYSAGIIIKSYSKGYSSFGLDLKMEDPEQAGWFIAEGEIVDTLYYYDVFKQMWIGHPKLLPESIDNPLIGVSEGHMVFVKNELKVIITGRLK